MNQQALDAWRNRPMSVTVKELCPKCEKLTDGVQKRRVYGMFGQAFSVLCCAPCAPLLQLEYLGN
jgi:hypothetical protein